MSTPAPSEARSDVPIESVRVIDTRLPGAYVIGYSQRHQPDVLDRVDGPAHIGVYPGDRLDHLITSWNRRYGRHRTDGPAYTMSEGAINWTVDHTSITQVFSRKAHYR